MKPQRSSLGRTTKARRNQRRFTLPELLEARMMLSATVYTVNSSADSGPGTLRDAINQVNAGSYNEILFDTSASGMNGDVITLASSLPAITNSVSILGTTDPSQAPTVQLVGPASGATGLELEAGGIVVQGLAFSGFGAVSAGSVTAAGTAVQIDSAGNDTIQGNWFGLNLNGSAATNDLAIDVLGGNNLITGNVIAAGQTGVTFNSGSAAGNVLSNNLIGLDSTGLQSSFGNNGNGVEVDASTGVTIQGNTISSNGGNGILLADSTNNIIRANFIGTDKTGSGNNFNFSNIGDGIRIIGLSGANTVGGSAAADGNVIVGNDGNGVYLSDSGAQSTIASNRLGVDALGLSYGNAGDGIDANAGAVTISDNLISGNSGYGIAIVGSSVTVTGNEIGGEPNGAGGYASVDPTGTALGNAQDGIYITGNNNTIGGAASTDANVIAYNGFAGRGGAGVTVFSGTGNAIRGNSIFGNATLGISLGPPSTLASDGVTQVPNPLPNDSQGHTSGPNLYQDYPVLTSVTTSASTSGTGTDIVVSGALNGDAATSYLIDLYVNANADSSGYGQGQIWVGSASVNGGSFKITFQNVQNLNGANWFSATATDPSGNTSEFAMDVAGQNAVTQPTPSTTGLLLNSSQNPSAFGQTITLTATITNGSSSLSGNVTFVDTTTGQTLGTIGEVNGQASIDVPFLSVGGHHFTAHYDGDTHDTASDAVLDQTVNKAATTTALSMTGTAGVGQQVTFTATVTPAPGTYPAGTIPTGTITFMDGSTVLQTVNLAADDTASFSMVLTTGSHSITAVYSGDTNFTASTSPTLNPGVNALNTTLSLTSDVDPSVFGGAVTLTATIFNGAPGLGGTVTFVDTTTGQPIGSPVNVANGQASVSISSLTGGSHLITATYSGDANDNGSSGSTTQIVNAANTATGLTASATAVTIGQSILLTATITPAAGTYPASPSGTVTFFDGTTSLGSAPVGAGGVASFTANGLAVGAHSITATYNGDKNFNSSHSAPVTPTVLAATSMQLATSITPSTFGQGVTFTATVVNGSSSLSGSVTFTDATTGQQLGVVALNGNQASLTTSYLLPGSHTINAVYSGDALDTSSNASLAQAINRAGTTTTLTDTNNSPTLGQAVTFTATVAPVAGNYPAGIVPTGTVMFMDGNTVLGTVMLSSNGTAALTTSSLEVGSHAITAVYNSDSNFAASQSAAVDPDVIAAGGSISGHTYFDVTGDGLSADDEIMGGITVELFTNLNNAPIQTKVSNQTTGAYSFTNLAPGTYYVEEVTPNGYLQTAPAASHFYSNTLGNGGVVSNDDFDNFQQCNCKNSISGVSFLIDGRTRVTDLRGHVHQGDTVQATFDVLSGHTDMLSLVSYYAPGSSFSASNAYEQKIYQDATGVFGPGWHTLTVVVPQCYFQIDFVCGAAIDQFGPAGSNIFYSAQGRLISADNGGYTPPPSGDLQH